MFFAVYCSDRPDATELRARTLEAHKAYIQTWESALVTSGPLLDDDGTTRSGQLYVIDVAHRDVADNFVSHDPFTLAGLFDTVIVRRFKPIIVGGKRLP